MIRIQWFLNAKGPSTVSSMGGRWSLRDNGEAPDTQGSMTLSRAAFQVYPDTCGSRPRT
jgi:hypothetical protein